MSKTDAEIARELILLLVFVFIVGGTWLHSPFWASRSGDSSSPLRFGANLSADCAPKTVREGIYCTRTDFEFPVRH